MENNRNLSRVFKAKIVNIKGHCNAGHLPGQTFTLNCYKNGGLCGFFYHDIFPNLSVLQFGGKYPWEDSGSLVLECPDRTNLVTIRLSRIDQPE